MVTFLNSLRDVLAGLDGDAKGLNEAWTRLLTALLRGTPADASTLMVADGDALRPVAALGLPDGIRGRRFALAEHPRLAAIAEHPGVCRFAADSDLPDPFDGLLDDSMSHVHDCLGVALRDGQRLVGLVTLDAVTPGSFGALDDTELLAAANLLGTCLRLAERLSQTRSQLSEVLVDSRRRAPIEHWNSVAMRRLMASVALVAPTDMSVLVHGETGVGKEAVARALHRASPRANGALVEVNCAALPESLIESALFGHRRGAFSGAVADHRGHFAMADGGTLVLDEIGEMPLALQPKLLRVLQDGEVQALGSERPTRVDVRIVAVTNRDLAAEVAAGRFREDLYHRLGAFLLRVPPLRDRPEDIPLLVGHFLEQTRRRLGVANLRLARGAEVALSQWPWPGNARELEHVISRGALLALGEHAGTSPRRLILNLRHDHLQLAPVVAPDSQVSALPARPGGDSGADDGGLREATDAFQREHIQRALDREGSWAGAARALDLDPANLHRLAKRLGLKARALD